MSKASAPRYRDLPRAGRAFVGAVMVAALLAVVAESFTDRAQSLDLTLFGIAFALCAGASLFEVFAPGHHSFQPNLVIFFWAAVLSPPWALAILAAACFVPGRVIRGSRWYMTAFNVANYTLGGIIAHEIASDTGAFWSHSPSAIVGGLLGAAAAFVALNHLMIVAVIRTAQRRPLREAGRVVRDGWSLDLALAMTGAVLALLWSSGRPFVALAAGPMLLIYRALWIPMLRHKSQTDPKTGLFNSEHFTSLLNDAVDHAVRHREDLSVVMFDLDHLRHVNNRCGHLAGDRLIRDVADVLTDVCPPGGVAARFGGEEFCVLLPGHATAEARAVAENARLRVEALSLRMDDAHDELHVTISGGVASYPEHGDTANGLLGAADAAVYDAKLGGRNRIRSALPPETRELLASPSGPLELPPTSSPTPCLHRCRARTRLSSVAASPSRRTSWTTPRRPLSPPGSRLPSRPAAGWTTGPRRRRPVQEPATQRRLRTYVGILCAAAVGVAFLGRSAAHRRQAPALPAAGGLGAGARPGPDRHLRAGDDLARDRAHAGLRVPVRPAGPDRDRGGHPRRPRPAPRGGGRRRAPRRRRAAPALDLRLRGAGPGRRGRGHA